MNLVRLLYLSLVSPRLAVLEVEGSFHFSYLLLSLFGFTLSQAALLISSSLVEDSWLKAGPFFLELGGSVLTGIVQVIFIGLMIHVVLSKKVDGWVFPKMLTSFFLVQMPFAYLVGVSILSQSIDIYAQNPALGMTFFLIFSAFLFGFVIYHLGKGIQIHYQADSWVQAFSILAISLFLAVFLQFAASAGMLLTLIASLLSL